MAGIRFAHTKNSLPDPFLAAPLLHLLLRGIKRTLGLTSRQHLPITITLLRQIKEELARAPDYLPTDKLMLWSAFTLAFYGFLRSSEFTSPSASQFNPLVHLSTIHVSFTSTGCLTLHPKASKMDLLFRVACIDGKTQTPISSCFKSRFKFTSVFNSLWKSSGATQRGGLPQHPHLPPLQHKVNPLLSPFLFTRTHVAEKWNFMHWSTPIWVLYIATTCCDAPLRHFRWSK